MDQSEVSGDQSEVSGPSFDDLFQSGSTKPIATYLGIMFAVFFIPGLQFFGKSSTNAPNPIAGGLLIAVGACGILWCAAFISRSGVKITEREILIRNWVRKYHISWTEIWGFRFGDQLPSNFGFEQMLFTPSLTPYAVLNSGKRIPMMGLNTVRIPRKASRTSVQIMLDELERLREKACSDGSSFPLKADG
jgi:hypothetical protein